MLFALALALAVTLAEAAPRPALEQREADAAPVASVVRVPLLERELRSDKDVKTVKAARIDLRAGQRSPKHVHPVPTMGVVLSGRIKLQVEGEPARILHAGQAFFEPAETPVLHFDNASASEPASFAAFYLLGPNDKEIVRSSDTVSPKP